MSVRLLVKQRSGVGNKPAEVVLDVPEITLGRESSCHVVLPESAVSRRHARILQDGALFFLEDLGSAFGTNINGKKLPKGEKRLLRNGDVIAIAQFDVVFERLVDLPPESEKSETAARKVIKDVMRRMGDDEGPFFRIMNGPREGERIPVSTGKEIIVGREPGCEVLLTDDDLISRKHAKIRRDWSGTHVEDLESRNGVRVNRKRITRKTLRDRDEVQIGATRFLYLDATEVRDEPVSDPDLLEMTAPPPAGKPKPPPPVASKPDLPPSAAAPVQPEPAPPMMAAPSSPPPEGISPVPDEDEVSVFAPRPLSPRAKIIALVAMGVFGVAALIVIVALMVGA